MEPGDALFCRTDVRFSHEYVTPMAESLFKLGLGENAEVKEPESVFAFRDHLTFLDRVMPQAHVEMGLKEQAASLATVQQKFTERQGIRLYGEVERDGKQAGSEGICHNIVIEELASPGQLVLGTDSHTCMAGALGCFAFGVGSTDMANAWFTKDVRVRVPETARVKLTRQREERGRREGRDAAPAVGPVLQDRQGHRQGAGVQRARASPSCHSTSARR